MIKRLQYSIARRKAINWGRKEGLDYLLVLLICLAVLLQLKITNEEMARLDQAIQEIQQRVKYYEFMERGTFTPTPDILKGGDNQKWYVN